MFNEFKNALSDDCFQEQEVALSLSPIKMVFYMLKALLNIVVPNKLTKSSWRLDTKLGMPLVSR